MLLVVEGDPLNFQSVEEVVLFSRRKRRFRREGPFKGLLQPLSQLSRRCCGLSFISVELSLESVPVRFEVLASTAILLCRRVGGGDFRRGRGDFRRRFLGGRQLLWEGLLSASPHRHVLRGGHGRQGPQRRAFLSFQKAIQLDMFPRLKEPTCELLFSFGEASKASLAGGRRLPRWWILLHLDEIGHPFFFLNKRRP